jgi:hypothetical protein
VWADSTDAKVESTANNQFMVRASGGTKIFSNASASSGVELKAGANAWSMPSDRSLKENFQPVDKEAVLVQVAALPIQRWNLKSQGPEISHIGPVAQDFHRAFGVGADERHINTLDADGVALVAIQALYQRTRAQEKTIQALSEQLAALDRELQILSVTISSRPQVARPSRQTWE